MAKKQIDGKKVALGVGLGLASAALGGAAYYFYGAKGAKANRKKAEKWAHDMKAEVIKKAKLAKKLDEKAMKTIVAEVGKAYEKVQSIDKKDVAMLANELKGNFAEIKKEVERVSATGAKKAVKAVKKVAKKVAPAKKAVAKAVSKKKVAKKK